MAEALSSGSLTYYKEAKWQLIPLHRPDYVDEKGRKRGKSPKDPKWTKLNYSGFDAVAHMEKGGNVGVRLDKDQLVIDVDPRNFGNGGTLDPEDTNNVLRQLMIDCDLEGRDYPIVHTGSGGLHIYMRKPEDLPIRDSMPEYPGIEFKTYGRQVVAAGSVHPDTGKRYFWEEDALDGPVIALKDAPMAPKFLLDLIARPQGAAQAAGGNADGGQYDQDEIAAMLDWLNPEDYRDHDKWLALMQACHHASGGDARIEFVEWSTRDPEYADQSAVIGQRWDSLHTEDPTRELVTYKTLLKAVRDAGGAESIPSDARDDFASEPDMSFMVQEMGVKAQNIPEHEQMSALEVLNNRYWCVVEGGRLAIMENQLRTELNPPERRWQHMSVDAFKVLYGNKRVPHPDDDEKTKKAGDTWLEWADRRTVHGVVFDPSGKEYQNRLNLWTGWGIRPANNPGGWSLLEELIRNTLASGDEKVAEYILKWCAYMFQFPAHPAETAICFQGAKGTGKGTLGRALRTIAGRHGMQIASSEHLTGRFNSHLRELVFLFADEALAPHDKAGESRLKALITEPMQSYEQKGRDVTMAPNYIHIMMASNEDWVVPAGLDGERRFMLQRVSTNRQGDKEFFRRLNYQLYGNGQAGLKAFLWDMLKMDLKGWKPSDAIPDTAALVEQKMSNTGPYERFLLELASADGLDNLGLSVAEVDEDKDWNDEAVRFFRRDFYEALDRYMAKHSPPNSRYRKDTQAMRTRILSALLHNQWDARGTTAKIPEHREHDLKPVAKGNPYAQTVRFASQTSLRRHFEIRFGGELAWS